MKTNVSITSIRSYDHLKLDGMAHKQQEIISVMLPGVVYSRRQLSVLTGLETSCVAGRVRELLDDEVLEVAGTIHCPITDRNVEAVRLAADQKELFA